MNDFYSVNQKVEDNSKVESSPYTQPWVAVCISPDDFVVDFNYVLQQLLTAQWVLLKVWQKMCVISLKNNCPCFSK